MIDPAKLFQNMFGGLLHHATVEHIPVNDNGPPPGWFKSMYQTLGHHRAAIHNGHIGLAAHQDTGDFPT